MQNLAQIQRAQLRHGRDHHIWMPLLHRGRTEGQCVHAWNTRGQQMWFSGNHACHAASAKVDHMTQADIMQPGVAQAGC